MIETEYSLQTGYRLENSGTDEDTTRSVEHGPREMEEMASRITLEHIVNLPKELNRRIPNGTYGGVRGMNNLYSIKGKYRFLHGITSFLVLYTYYKG